MIYTRFGTPITGFRAYNARTGEVFARREDRPKYDLLTHISELKADGGLAEIQDAIGPCPQCGQSPFSGAHGPLGCRTDTGDR